MQSTTAPKSAPLVPLQNEVAGASAKAKAKSKVTSVLKKLPQNGGRDSDRPVSAPAVPPLGKASSKGTNESSHAPVKRESQWHGDGDWYGDGCDDSSGWNKNKWQKNSRDADRGGGAWGRGGGKKSYNKKGGRDSGGGDWHEGSTGGDWHQESNTSRQAASSAGKNGHTNDVTMGDSSKQPVAAPAVPPLGKATTCGKATSLGSKATSKSSGEAGSIPPKSKAVWQQPAVSKPKSVGPLNPQPLNPQPLQPLGLQKQKPAAPLQSLPKAPLQSLLKKVIPGAGVKVKHQVQLRHLPKGKAAIQQLRKQGPGGPGVPPAGVRAGAILGKMTKMSPLVGRYAPLRQQPKQTSVPKTGSTIMSSKAPPPKVQIYPRSCLCGNLTDTTYYVMFMTGQSYCTACWEKLDKPMGFVQSLEQMKRLGALCLNTKMSA